MTETIGAIATGGVRSGVGIIRLSGPNALSAAEGVFTPARGGCLSDHPPGQMVYGTLRAQGGAELDHILAVHFRAPHSYTGEHTAELHCHGSPTVLALALEALFAHGVRQARPGEFTRRAVLGGKLDLAQAEAVMDLIDAETPAAAHNAAGQMAGALSKRVDAIYSGLLDVMAHFHAVLDYPDEDITPFRADTIAQALDRASADLAALLAGYERGRYLTAGVPCAIVGRPNVGKSSLLNALLGHDRAIVTSHPGTTRDTVEERCTLGGTLLRLIDTAGLRESGDEVERLGIARSRAALASAALALVVLDGSEPLTEEDAAVLDAAAAAPRAICVVNKSDLPAGLDAAALRTRFPHVCTLSAATGAGLDALESAVAALFPPGDAAHTGALLTNARQQGAALEAARRVRAAQTALLAGVSADALLLDVEEALSALGELTGRTLREDVIARIFARFCVGK